MIVRYRSFVEVSRDRVSDCIEKYLTRVRSCDIDRLIDEVAKTFLCDGNSVATRRQIRGAIESEASLNRLKITGSSCERIVPAQSPSTPQTQRIAPRPPSFKDIREQIAAPKHSTPETYPKKVPAKKTNGSNARGSASIVPSVKRRPNAKKKVPSNEVSDLIRSRINVAGGRIARADLMVDIKGKVVRRRDLNVETLWDAHVLVGKTLSRDLELGYLVEVDEVIYSSKSWKKHARAEGGIYRSPKASAKLPQPRVSPQRTRPVTVAPSTKSDQVKREPMPQNENSLEEWKAPLAQLLHEFSSESDDEYRD